MSTTVGSPRAAAHPRQRGVVICTSGPSQPGSKQNWALAQFLAEMGYEVTLLVDGRRGDLIGEWRGCAVRTWPSLRPTRLKDGLYLWSIIRRSHPDAILANFGSVNAAIVVSWLGRVPVRVAWYRTLSTQIALDSPSARRWSTRFRVRRKALVYLMASHLVPVSKVALDDICRTFGVPSTKCQIFHTCREDPRDVVKTSPPRDDAEFRIVCVGRMVPSKGQDLLIRAIDELRRLEPTTSLSLELIGDGPERPACQSLVRTLGLDEITEFAGAVEHEEVFRRLARAHVMAVPFRTDAGPGVVAEALGSSLPLVMSSTGALPDQVGNSPCALLVPPDDVIALAMALRKVLTDPELRRAMSVAARALFEARFSQAHWVDEVAVWLSKEVGAT